MNTAKGSPATGLEAQSTPAVNVYQAVAETMPLLQLLRDEQGIGYMLMPSDHPTLPNELVLLKPRYMNRSDPPHLGIWEMSIGALQTRITTEPSRQGLHAYVTTMDQGGPREVNAIEGQRVADALFGLSDLWKETEQQAQETPSRHLLNDAIGKVLHLGRSS